MPAHDALFGYDDPILTAVKQECLNNTFIPSIISDCPNHPVGKIILSLPDKFGILVLKSSPLGWFNYQYKTGTDDYHNYLKIEKFDGKEKLDWWLPDGPCNDVNGTDGASIFPDPTPGKGEHIDLFSPDAYRSLAMNWTEQVKSIHYDLDTYRYELQSYIFAAPVVNPDNKCYCIDEMF